MIQIRKDPSESESWGVGTLHDDSEAAGIDQNAPGQTMMHSYPAE